MMKKTNSNYCFSLLFSAQKHLLKARKKKADKESSAKVETKGADAKRTKSRIKSY
jgi:hypothetical protein